MKNFKLKMSLLRIWFVKNIVVFLEIVALILFILTFTGVLPAGFPIFGKLSGEIKEALADSNNGWIKVISILSSSFMSVSVFLTKAKSIALADIKNDNVKVALIRAGFYFNEKGQLVKKYEKVTNKDLNGDGKIGDDTGEGKVSLGLFSGAINAVQEFFAIASLKIDDTKSEKEAYSDALEKTNMTEAAAAVDDMNNYITDKIIENAPEISADIEDAIKEKKESGATVGFFGNIFLWIKSLFERAKVERLAKKLSKQSRVFQKMTPDSLNELQEAVFDMSEMKRGALFVIMGKENIFSNGSVTQIGSAIDWEIKKQTIEDMFIVGTELHDGAAVIDGNKIVRGAVFVKPTTTPSNGKFGARHQAAKGISENSDSISILVSEESGEVLIGFKGSLMKVTKDNFISTIKRCYLWIDILPVINKEVKQEQNETNEVNYMEKEPSSSEIIAAQEEEIKQEEKKITEQTAVKKMAKVPVVKEEEKIEEPKTETVKETPVESSNTKAVNNFLASIKR